LDAATDIILESDWTTFEMEGLVGLSELTVIPMLDYLFHRIEQRLDGRPTLIALDELAAYLDHPSFGQRIVDWVLTLRKRNAAVILSTPTIAGLTDSPHFHTLVESCPTKIFLPNPEAQTSTAAIYELFGLSQRQRQVIAEAVPKRDYYYTSPLGKRLFDLTIDPATLSFVGAGSREDIAAVRALSAEPNWPAEWLRRRGLTEWADYWEKLEALR
jgi:type IV secretion system protein VirB4